jgi:hypothetical protein
MKIINCESVYDLLEDRRTRYKKSMKNVCKRKIYKNII